MTEKKRGDKNEGFTIERDAILSSDGKQLLVRIPLDIAVYGRIKKGDKIHFRVDAPSRTNKGESKTTITLIGGETNV